MHESLLLKTVKNLTNERNDYSIEMAALKNRLILNDERMQMIEKENGELKAKLEQQSDRLSRMETKSSNTDKQQTLKNRISQLEKENAKMRQKIDRQKVRLNQLEEEHGITRNDVVESAGRLTGRFECLCKRVADLKIFAEWTSQFHLSLSHWLVNQEERCYTLAEKNYEDNKHSKNWRFFLQSVVEKTGKIEKDSSYLNTFVNATKQYADLIYPKVWYCRIMQVADYLEPGKFNDSEYLKVNAPECFGEISVKCYKDDGSCMNEVSENLDVYFLQSPSVATYYDGGCFYVALELWYR